MALNEKMIFKAVTENKRKIVQFKVKMMAEEWDKVKYYTKTDADGKLATDTSKLLKCGKTNKKGIKLCTLTLGYYPNYKKLGFSTPWQTEAGWTGPADGQGFIRTPDVPVKKKERPVKPWNQ